MKKKLDLVVAVVKIKIKKTGRITTTINLEGYGNDLNAISKIKKVSTYNNTKMRLLYDEAIEINLSN
jgi:hypothetical protein